MNLTQQIEAELTKKDTSISGLMIATLTGYSEVIAALKQLLDEEKVDRSWKNSELFFHLRKRHEPNPTD